MPVLAAALAGLMMLVAAIRGLRREARLRERFYTLASVAWAVLGVAVYRPALLGGAVPTHLAQNHLVMTGFGLGLVALGAYGASLLIGDR